MTDEHLPPRAANNSSPMTLYNERDGALVAAKSYLEGHAIPSLCAPCNNRASRRGLPQAYTAWRTDVLAHINLAAATLEFNTGRARTDFWTLQSPDGGAFYLPFEHGKGVDSKKMMNLHPGRIARQILGMILAVQSTRELVDDHSNLTTAYSSDGPTSIEPFSLHVALADAGLNYFNSDARSIRIDLRSGNSTDVGFWMISFPPFLMCLANGPEAPIAATRIDQWLAYPIDRVFPKNEREVAYPIANQDEPLVAKMYAGLGR
ncbi:hypothetical protein [Mycobacterium marinum]|uniref:hypothetical protein n=1 Tax=Mycobacterium marinum TaxID=1781 RepID=UPI001922946A|nr:hypothetical protein [Mycobacterium marinum]QQW36306.1 hypothetical protein HXW97_22590 [Mycobacterium marinum]